MNRYPVMSLTLLLTLVVAGSPAAAQTSSDTQTKSDVQAETHWLTDKRGCKFANPTPKPKETITWSGACVDGYMSGKGVLQFYEDGVAGARYEGTLEAGRLTGRGLLKTVDGATYEGDWVDGQQDGYGKYVAADGASYQGGWTAGQPDGAGVLHTPTGEVIHGKWEKGKLVERYEQ